MAQKIAFVGVGRMGANMARRLKDCGYSVTAVYDTYREGAVKLAEELGCQACEKLADVTVAADVIFTVVTNDAAMHTIFLDGSDNLLVNAGGKVFVNCATVSPAIHREIYAASEKAGAQSHPQGLLIHVGHHQHFVGVVIRGNGRDEPVLVKFWRKDKALLNGLLRVTGSKMNAGGINRSGHGNDTSFNMAQSAALETK